jgi:hypothetical protein
MGIVPTSKRQPDCDTNPIAKRQPGAPNGGPSTESTLANSMVAKEPAARRVILDHHDREFHWRAYRLSNKSMLDSSATGLPLS